jgi:hypothetical protein
MLALTVAVLMAHVVLLRGAPGLLDLSRLETPRVFNTRRVELAAALPLTPGQSAQSGPATVTAVAASRSGGMTSPVVTGRYRPTGDTEEAQRVAATQSSALVQLESGQVNQPVASTRDEQISSPDVAPGPVRPQAESAVLAGLATVPESVLIKYQVTANKFPYRLNAELGWQKNGEDYETRMEISAFGLSRVQTSRGLVTPQGLAPIRFSDKYRSEVAAHFNREKGKVTFSANTPDVILQAGAQDRLSIMIQLAALIAAAPARFPLDTVIATQTIGPRDADTWLFTVGIQETLSLPGGELPALKLQRNPRQEFDQRVELWLAPALGYLPARIRITEPNGDYVDQKWLETLGQIPKSGRP